MNGSGLLPATARELIARDPLLPRYCRVAEHATGDVELRSLLADGVGEQRPMRELLAARPDGWTELDYALEFLVRPVVITVRGLLALDWLPAGELGVRPGAGQVVLRGLEPADPHRCSRLVLEVHELLSKLTESVGGTVDDLEQVLAEELCDLSERLLAALGGHHPWRPFLHSVPEHQQDLLQRVLRLVRERAAARRRDPSAPRPLVALDLDFCALHPRERVRAALERVSREHGVVDFAFDLAQLPGLYEPGWRPFLEHLGLPDDGLYPAFRAALGWERADLLTDEPAPGVRGFVRDVEEVGGQVVLVTGRRHRMRAATEELLARCGLGHLPLHTTDEGADVAEQKVAALRSVPGELIAAFDDKADNLAALRAAFPEARVVPVAAPGFTGVDEPGAIGTFELLPHPVPLGRGHAARPQLSHASSPARLRVGDFSTRPTWWRHGVRLTREQRARIVAALRGNALEAGRRLGERVRDTGDGGESAIWRVLVAKPFGAARPAYPPELAAHDLRPAVREGTPVPLVMIGPPIKQDGSRLKALGARPDLAELAMLVRLVQLDAAVRVVHPAGIRVTALADPSHFRYRPADRCGGYHEDFARMLAETGADEFMRVRDLDEAAAEAGCARDRRAERVAAHRARYEEALAGLDVTADPIAALAAADERDPALAGQPRFVELFRSVLHAVDLPRPGGDPLAHARRVYADPLDLRGEAREARRELLSLAWRETITYLANKHVDAELDYSALWRGGVRMSLSLRPVPGRLRFVPLGGGAAMPWHGTAALGDNHEVSVDFAISLVDQGFVPVWTPGDDAQPWFMAPPQALRGDDLDPEVLDRIRIRAK
ncbi:HAD family hydrolase [Saccharopolyspora griseoalba]|uniref:HAD family hydrolase n=1 Tax=Saccharopolyspora griseoalba TaxID=1431848 RepID=A0ABW2LMZ0_9PSEU